MSTDFYIHLTNLVLKNYVSYERVDLRLDAAPVTVVRGHNIDSKTGKLVDANGAGKSLLFTSLTNLFQFEPPMSVNKNEVQAFHRKDSLIRVNFQVGKHSMRFEQYGKGEKGVGYRIYKDDTDMRFQKIRHAQKYMREVFPYNLEQFNTLLFLSAFVPSPLQRGTGSARHDFFEGLFESKIEQFDLILKNARKDLSDMRDYKAQIKMLESQLSSQPERVSLSKLRTKLDAAKETYDIEHSKLTKYKERQNTLTTYLQLADDLDETLADVDLDEAVDALSSKLEKIKRNIEAARTYEKDRAVYKQARKERRRIKERLEELTPASKMDSLREEFETVKPEYSKWKARYRDWEAVVEAGHYAEWKKLGKELVDTLPEIHDTAKRIELDLPTDPAKLVAAIDKLHGIVEGRKDQLKEQRRRLKESENECVVCGSTLKHEHHKKLLKDNAKLIGICEALETLFSDTAKYASVDRKVRPFVEIGIDRIERKYKKLLKEAKGLHASYQEAKEASALEERLAGIEVPNLDGEKPEHDSDHYEKQRSKVELELTRHKTEAKLRKQLDRLEVNVKSVKAAREECDRLAAKVEKRTKMVDELSSEVRKLEMKIETEKSARSQRNDLETRYADLKDKIKDQKLLKAIEEAYGPYGMRVKVVEDFANLYVQNLNRYSSFVYNENMIFDAEVKNRDCRIIVHGKNRIASDVRYLSGAESRRFMLLNIMAILPIVPAHLRTNLLVLDEMESSMSAVNRNKYLFDFIPKLNQIIPNIFLVTPMSRKELYVPHARELTVVRKDGISKVEGDL